MAQGVPVCPLPSSPQLITPDEREGIDSNLEIAFATILIAQPQTSLIRDSPVLTSMSVVRL